MMSVAKRLRIGHKDAPFGKEFREALGPEASDGRHSVYLVTISRVLPGAATEYRDLRTVTRDSVAAMLRDSFDNPVPSAVGGRPREAAEGQVLVDCVIVAQEAHADGSPHFHAAIKLTRQMRFRPAKQTLVARHMIPSHWSCSHTQLWSAVRYIHVPTPRKPVVDQHVWAWAHDGRPLDLMEMSREPWTAAAWRKRREGQELSAALEDKKQPAFTKLDLQSLILSKHLHTKASLLAYVQSHGSPAAQLYVSRQQRRIVEFIEDAQEWASAAADTAAEKMSDMDVLVKAAETACAHAPQPCPYCAAVTSIFKRNAAFFSPGKLAAALRAVLQTGPSKTCRVPMLVGPSNTGKSTLVYPFDDLFGPKNVLHKPALGSTFALRNITKGKRFIFWDDFRPVEFAHHHTVPAATFLSVFIGKQTEIQVSQSFNDGNAEVHWQRGVVFTAKEEGLWVPTNKVPAEDVRHMRNRVEEFRFGHPLADSDIRDVESCAPCMARWILKLSEEAAAGAVPAQLGRGSSAQDVSGFDKLMAEAVLPELAADDLLHDVEGTGARDVKELELADWQALPAWGRLRPMEQRRMKSAIATATAARQP